MVNAPVDEYCEAQPGKQTLSHFIETPGAIANRNCQPWMGSLKCQTPTAFPKEPRNSHCVLVSGLEVHILIAFCTHCWAEIDDALDSCPRCGRDLASDSRSYEQKLVAALRHPLPEARVRICWLIGENQIRLAVPALMRIAEFDPDLFVRKAALEALAVLRDPRALPLLEAISGSSNRFLAAVARRSLEAIISSARESVS